MQKIIYIYIEESEKLFKFKYITKTQFKRNSSNKMK
jgi:hypothetical protein